VFVNSDGNLTFGKGDADITDRSLGRMVAGPPRIAPLFTDLDPTSATAPNGIRVLSDSSRLVVTWSSVPVWDSFGGGTPQTFQVQIFPDGRIAFIYSGAGSGVTDSVVGIAPGGMRGSTSIISFTDPTSSEFSAAIAERFTDARTVDIATLAQKFYATHDDAYDYLVIYNSVGVAAASGAVAYEVTTRNNRSGYGDDVLDIGTEFGSPRRLQAVMNMGPLYQYLGKDSQPLAPDGIVSARGPTGDTPVTVLGHEAGHLFLAFASVPDPNDPHATPMLGRDGVHWAFTFNSEASLLEGNRIQDNGAGASPRFKTTATVEGYSPLDQYLMGFREPTPSEVPPTFAVLNSGQSSSAPPKVGVGFNGDRLDISIDDVIAAEGRRTPDSTVAQRHFRFAFVLIVPPGTKPTTEVAQVDAYRTAFEQFYPKAASNRAFADTSLRRGLQLSAAPASGVVAGSNATATIALNEAATTPVTIFLEPASGSTGSIAVPQSVTIPAGASEASFDIGGITPGVVELTARPRDSSYETANARIQILGSNAALQLSVVSGDNQGAAPGTPLAEPIVLRVTDVNRLPYPGVRVAASVSNGSLDAPAAITDQDGNATFRWTPGAGGPYELSASIDGVPTAAVAVRASSPPAVSANGVVNAASYSPGITPGSIATIFGSNLAAGSTAQATALPLPYRLANIQVMVNGSAAQLYYASDGQVNFLAPAPMNGDTAEIVIRTSAGTSTAYHATVLPTAPGIFFDSGTGNGAILIAGTAQTTLDRPAAAGDVIEIYCTGLGPTISSDGYDVTTTTPQVRIGGIAASVQFSGRAPGYPGLYQINAAVPSGLPSGVQPLSVEMNGASSNDVKVQLQ
jgi:uncharacterized protein (TIGR03437 family)